MFSYLLSFFSKVGYVNVEKPKEEEQEEVEKSCRFHNTLQQVSYKDMLLKNLSVKEINNLSGLRPSMIKDENTCTDENTRTD